MIKLPTRAPRRCLEGPEVHGGMRGEEGQRQWPEQRQRKEVKERIKGKIPTEMAMECEGIRTDTIPNTTPTARHSIYHQRLV